MTELERQLTRQLSPVRAPDDLWDRIHEQRRPLRVSRTLGPGAQLAAAALVILTTGFATQLVPSGPQAYVDIDIQRSSSLIGARLTRWKNQSLAPEPQTQAAACTLCHADTRL